ncbi:MAG: efflux RND transporter periplasmic adaptor subunit [Glaciecola sp.]|jgi:RND family efflux transporter MFP subunit
MKIVVLITSCLIALFILILLITAEPTHFFKTRTESNKLDSIRTDDVGWALTPIQVGSVSIEQNLVGRVRIEGIVKVSSEVSGKVKTLSVEEGSKVSKGHVLAEIDDEKLRATYKLRAASLDSKQAQLKGAILRMEEASRNFDRAKQANSKLAITLSELERLKFEFDVKAVQVKAIEADVDIAQAALDEISIDLTKTRIISPTDGEITAKHIELGETVNVRQNSVTLFQVTPDKPVISIYSELSEDFIQYVTENYLVTVSSNLLAPKILKCHITKKFRNPIVRQEFVFYGILIKCTNPPVELWAGMTVNVNLEIKSSNDRMLIEPNSFLYELKTKSNISDQKFGYRELWVKTKAGELKKRNVMIGLSNKLHSEILAGDLKETDRVFTKKY